MLDIINSRFELAVTIIQVITMQCEPSTTPSSFLNGGDIKAVNEITKPHTVYNNYLKYLSAS